MKLVTLEAETDALRAHVAQYQRLITSRLATVEVPRALARRGIESTAECAEPLFQALEALQLVELDAGISGAAASRQVTLPPRACRGAAGDA